MRRPLLLCLSTLVLLSCDFRRPDEGYDPDWSPDHEVSADDERDRSAPAATDGPDASGPDDSFNADRRRRPSEIAADTGTMAKAEGTWEMIGVEKTDYTVYRSGGEIAMIVEKTPGSVRTYYFDAGALYYFNEKSDDASTELTVEFDDIGDALGARKTIDGDRIRVDSDDLAEIVKHAVELKIAAEEHPGDAGRE